MLGIFGMRAVRKPVASSSSARLFLQLREAGRRAGIPPDALHSPLSLVRHMESARHPGARSARAVVDAYLRDRFSGTGIGQAGLRRMRVALTTAKRALRKHSFR